MQTRITPSTDTFLRSGRILAKTVNNEQLFSYVRGLILHFSEAVGRRCSAKIVFFEISKNS